MKAMVRRSCNRRRRDGNSLAHTNYPSCPPPPESHLSHSFLVTASAHPADATPLIPLPIPPPQHHTYHTTHLSDSEERTPADATRPPLARRLTPADVEAAPAVPGRPFTEDRSETDAAAAAATLLPIVASAAPTPPSALLTASLAALRCGPSRPDSAAVSSPGAKRPARASASRAAAPRTSAALSMEAEARACGQRGGWGIVLRSGSGRLRLGSRV